MNDEGKPHDQHEMKFQKLQATVEKFVLEECIPAEKEYKNHISNRIGKDRWSIDVSVGFPFNTYVNINLLFFSAH